MSDQHKIFQHQIVRATDAGGQLDLSALTSLVVAAYEEAERDRDEAGQSLEQLRHELEAANAYLFSAFDVVSEGIVLLDADGRFVLYNRQFVEFYDTVRDMVSIGGSFAAVLQASVERGHQLDAIGREEEWLAQRLALHAENSCSFEKHIRGDRWVRVEERKLSTGGTIGIRVDITDFKRREEVLKKRSEQLLEAQVIGKVGDWTYALGARTVWWSQQIYDLLRQEPGDVDPTVDEVMGCYLGGSAKAVIQAQSDVIRTREVRSVDVQMERGDGSVGDFIVITKPTINSEGLMVGFTGTIQDISERKHFERELQRLAYYDPLTGVANRALFRIKINDALTQCKSEKVKVALLLLDLDHFKEINDSLGHAAGDELLCRVTEIISRVLKPNCFFSRLSGDEFAIIAHGVEDEERAASLARTIIMDLAAPVDLERGEVNVGVSIGVSMLPRDGATPSDALRNVDLALYQAKEQGRNRFAFYQKELNTAVQHKVTIGRELRRAISESSGLTVLFQPQVNVATGKVVSHEALLRWHHPAMGQISPSQFIPVAESSQLICELGLWVLGESVRHAKQWYDSGYTACQIGVNVSAAQIWHTDFARDVGQVLERSGLPPHFLCLELTESLLATRAEGRVRRVLRDLKELGVSLALDDFGTDYSSLGYLTQLPFDKLKIDKIFSDEICRSQRARNLLEGIIALGRGLEMTTIAEGIESAEQVAVLRDLHCDIIQGFVFAQPMAADDAAAYAMVRNGHTATVQPMISSSEEAEEFGYGALAAANY